MRLPALLFPLLLLLLVLPLKGITQNRINVDDSTKVYSLTGIMKVIEDEKSLYTYADISGNAGDDKWKNACYKYSYDFTKSSFWTKTNLHFSQKGRYIFFYDYNGVNSVDFFIESDSGVIKIEGGSKIPYSQRNDFSNKIALSINVNGISDFTVYSHIKGGYGMSFFPAYISKENAFTQRTQLENIFTGFFYGICFIMFITFLFSYVFTKDKNYLLYILVVIFHLLNRVSFMGHLDFLLGNYPLYRNYLDSITQSLSMVIVSYFIIHFLQTKKYFKWQHYGLVACICIMCIAFILSFINPWLGIIIGNNVGILIMIFSISAAWVRIKKYNYRPARYFIIGWSGFYLGVILLILTYTGVLPSYYLYSFQLGIIAEMLFFSMAVAENYKLLKDQEHAAQKKAFEALQENERIILEQNSLLENKVKERTRDLALKNQEITDSITYAKRLQEAILPPIEFIEKHNPNNFILYLPKDIVAGDFYWAEQVTTNDQDLFFIAAADSTGHGVPGAMVSVVCSNALNRTIKEFKLTDPGKILDKTRDLVLETFEKSASEVKDGMDISLLCIDTKNKKVSWSGANNPLWYVIDGVLHEVKADKQPVGKTDNPKPFTTHQIEYIQNTFFYLFTDGLADQFGGPLGKKFKYKPFGELLRTNSYRPCLEQSEQIQKVFVDWKGKLEQVDDVCIVGIRI